MRLTLRQQFAAVMLLFLGGCGHIIPGSLTGGEPYDFSQSHDCAEPEPVGDRVEVRYLGSGGVYIRWHDDAILIGSSFSNPGMIRARFLCTRHDAGRIGRALEHVDKGRVRAIFAGHSHYDHIGDLPIVAGDLIKDVPIWVNATGVNALAGEPKIRECLNRIVPGDTVEVTPSIHVRSIVSGHAPQLCKWRRFPCVYAAGEIEVPWTTPLTKHRLAALSGGETFAFDIELRDATGVRYRIYYNDSSPDSPAGQTTGDFDLAIICLAQWKWVRDYPGGLLAALQPRHVVISHWDDFFIEARPTTRFIRTLSDASAAEFLGVVNEYVSDSAGPVGDVCGVKTPHWTMPAPASSMLFKPRPVTETRAVTPR
jgi:hypothetical protein